MQIKKKKTYQKEKKEVNEWKKTNWGGLFFIETVFPPQMF
jgi:hypothetical protein